MSETLTDRDFWSVVPSVDEPAERDDGPDSRAAMGDLVARVTASRRATLKAIATLGGALALNVVGWLPPFRARSASAAVGIEYGNCNSYTPIPEYTGYCYPGPDSPDYCGGDGWFLQASSPTFSSGPVATCAGGTPKNAWRWAKDGVVYRCADGFLNWGGSQQFAICRKAKPGVVVP